MFSGSCFRICILSRFGVSRGSDLEPFWHASSRTRPRKFGFFWSQPRIKCFFAFRLSLDMLLEGILKHFCVFWEAILATLGCLGWQFQDSSRVHRCFQSMWLGRSPSLRRCSRFNLSSSPDSDLKYSQSHLHSSKAR